MLEHLNEISVRTGSEETKETTDTNNNFPAQESNFSIFVDICEEDMKKMKVGQLKAELKKRGASTSDQKIFCWIDFAMQSNIKFRLSQKSLPKPQQSHQVSWQAASGSCFSPRVKQLKTQQWELSFTLQLTQIS